MCECKTGQCKFVSIQNYNKVSEEDIYLSQDLAGKDNINIKQKSTELSGKSPSNTAQSSVDGETEGDNSDRKKTMTYIISLFSRG